MQSIDLIPVHVRTCDLCNESVTDEGRNVIRSFVLTDWGAICIECWDNRIDHREDFKVVRSYVKSTIVEDEWIRRPLAFLTFSP